MISQESSVRAIELAGIAKNKGVQLLPKENSPLAVLCRNTHFDMSIVESQEVASAVAVECFDGNSTLVQAGERLAAGADTGTHDSNLDQLVAEVGEAVTKHIGFIHGTVLPVVREFSQNVQDQIQGHADSGVGEYEVKTIRMPAGLMTDVFMRDLEKKATGRFINPQGILAINEPEVDYVKLAKTGYKAFDDEVAFWVKDSLVTMFVWGAFFDRRVLAQLRDSVTNVDPDLKQLIDGALSGNMTLVDLVSNQAFGGQIALIAYLFTQSVKNLTLTNVQHSPAEFEQLVDQYLDLTASRLQSFTKSWQAALAGDVVVQRVTPLYKKIFVIEETYLKFIRHGGSNEALLGSLVSKLNPTTIGDLLENKEALEKLWTAFAANKENEARLAHYNNAITVIKSNFYALLSAKNIGEIEQDYWDKHPGHGERVGATFDQLVKDLSLKDLNDVDELCCNLVCKARFAYTSADKFFASMKEAFASNPDIDPKAAAEQAKVNYVIDYVLSQVRVA